MDLVGCRCVYECICNIFIMYNIYNVYTHIHYFIMNYKYMLYIYNYIQLHIIYIMSLYIHATMVNKEETMNLEGGVSPRKSLWGVV